MKRTAPASPKVADWPLAPSEELAPTGPDTGDAVAEAVGGLLARPERDSGSGRFVPGNLAAARHLGRSAALLDALGPAKRELAERVRADLALGSDAPATLEALADAFAEVSLLRRSLFVRLSEQGGILTGRGRIRAALAGYLQVLDREAKLATTLGLERKSRPVDPIQAVRDAVERANASASAEVPA